MIPLLQSLARSCRVLPLVVLGVLLRQGVVGVQQQLVVLVQVLGATRSELRHLVSAVGGGDLFAGKEKKLHHGTNDCEIASVCGPKHLMIGMA